MSGEVRGVLASAVRGALLGCSKAYGWGVRRRNRAFDGGLQLLEYVPTVLDGPPGV